MSSIDAAAAQLLSADQDFNVALLDDIVAAAYSPTDPNRARANTALIALQESPHAWTKADGILENAKNPQSLFFGLQLLDDAIRTRYTHCLPFLWPRRMQHTSRFFPLAKMESNSSRTAPRHKKLRRRENHPDIIRCQPRVQRENIPVQVESNFGSNAEARVADELAVVYSRLGR